MQTIFKTYLIISLLLLSGQALSNETEQFLQLDKDGIKIYLFGKNSPNVASFKAVTHLKASIDSILAVMFDTKNCIEWIHACKNSLMIENLGFNERYHYQSISIPFPFKNREFIFHSVLKQDAANKTVKIMMLSAPDYCNNKPSEQCRKINQSNLVRVNHSIGIYKLETDKKGTKVTWIQYTDPGGNLPNWLVNQFVKDTPYRTLKNLAEKVQEKKYKDAELIYDDQGMAIEFNDSGKKRAQEFDFYPTF